MNIPKKIISVIDYIVTRGLAFVVIFIWFRAYYFSNTQAALYALAATLGLIFIFDLLLFKRKKKYAQKKAEQELAQKYTQYFSLRSDKENLLFFETLLSKKFEVQIEDKIIKLRKNNEYIALIPKFLPQKLSPQNLTELIKESKDYKNIIILSGGFSTQTQTFAQTISDKKIYLYDENDTYMLMKEYDCLFELPATPKKASKKAVFMELAQYALSKKRFKGYLFASLILLLYSFVIPYSIYYRIAGSLLLIMAIVSLKDIQLKPKTQKII